MACPLSPPHTHRTLWPARSPPSFEMSAAELLTTLTTDSRAAQDDTTLRDNDMDTFGTAGDAESDAMQASVKFAALLAGRSRLQRAFRGGRRSGRSAMSSVRRLHSCTFQAISKPPNERQVCWIQCHASAMSVPSRFAATHPTLFSPLCTGDLCLTAWAARLTNSSQVGEGTPLVFARCPCIYRHRQYQQLEEWQQQWCQQQQPRTLTSTTYAQPHLS